MSMHYILDEKGRPVPEPDLINWARWMEAHDRHVAKYIFGEVIVSTVFLGSDHGSGFTGTPILWETMVFNGPLSHEQDRCSGNREQAEAMHAAMVKRVKEAK